MAIDGNSPHLLVRVKQRNPAEVRAYHEGWQAGVEYALRQVQSGVEHAERFAAEAKEIQDRMDAAVALEKQSDY